jgi:hypothetical protein
MTLRRSATRRRTTNRTMPTTAAIPRPEVAPTVTDETIRSLLRGSCAKPLATLEESDGAWHLRTFSILKYGASFHIGFGYSLRPESCFYKRWFDFPDLGKVGWAIMFHAYDPALDHDPKAWTEQFTGWVPPERVHDADTWIEFLNRQVHDRLAVGGREAQETPAKR